MKSVEKFNLSEIRKYFRLVLIFFAAFEFIRVEQLMKWSRFL